MDPAATGGFLDCYDRLVATYLEQVTWEPPREVEERAALLVGALLLGRVDGKSPVEYLDPANQEATRASARSLLQRPARIDGRCAEPLGRGVVTITEVRGRRVWDSRGRPTVEVEVHAGGAFGRAIAPAGASTGSGEAVERRDGGRRLGGLDVLDAVGNVNGPIAGGAGRARRR